MPVKPGTTFTFATNVNFSVGPFIGDAVKVIPADLANGFVPGTGIVPEWVNYLFHWSGNWITDWLAQGTPDADLDAHIVETDSDGQARIASMIIGGQASSERALLIEENDGIGGAITAEINNLAGGQALVCTSNDPNGCVQALNAGTGPALYGVAQGAGNVGVQGEGGTAGVGVVGLGGSGNADGVRGEGSGNRAGVIGEGGPTSGPGVVGLPGSTSGYGVRGETLSAATSSSAAVAAITLTGSGMGLFANSSGGTGYAVVAQADTTSPTRAPLRMVPQNDDPSSGAEGDVTYNSATDELRAYVNSRWQTALTTEFGHTRGAEFEGSATNNNSGSFTTAATCVLAAPYDPKHTGFLWLSAGGEFGATGGSIHTTIELRIRDTTSNVTVWSRTIDHPAAVGGPIYDRPWSIQVRYALPATGPRTLELQFHKPGGVGTGVQVRDAYLSAIGVF
jgi:hypothetical protein